MDDLLADHQSNEQPDYQPEYGTHQPMLQLFEVLPEGHRAFAEQIVFVSLQHQDKTSIRASRAVGEARDKSREIDENP